MADKRAPSVRARQLAAELRRLRDETQLTGEEVGERLGWSPAKVSRAETARTAITPADLARLLDLYEVSGQRRERLAGLGRSAGERGWWDAYADTLGPEYATLIALEAQAERIRWYAAQIVPGLLQTEDYARAVFSTRFGITDAEVEKRVASRLSRQEILTRGDPPKFWAILDEWVLRRPVGGPHVMLEQVDKLIEAARQPYIVIRIVPASVGVHEGLYGGGFAIADLMDGTSIGYQEGAVHGGQPIREAEDVESLNLVSDTLRDEALPRSASLALLEEAAKSWSSAT